MPSSHLPVAWRLLTTCLLATSAGAACTSMLRPGYVARANAAHLGHASNLQLTPAVVFQNGTGSASYHAPTFADLPRNIEVRDVRGRACESGLQVPWGALTAPAGPALDWMYASVGWGDSGYQRALREAAGQVAPDALLYDIRADLQTINVLSIWRQQCVVVTASAVTRMPDGPELLLPAAIPRPSVVPPAAPPMLPALVPPKDAPALPSEAPAPAPALAADPASVPPPAPTAAPDAPAAPTETPPAK